MVNSTVIDKPGQTEEENDKEERLEDTVHRRKARRIILTIVLSLEKGG